MEEMILARRRMLMNRSLAPVPASNITHYWKLNGNSLDSVSDAHGTNTNITFSSVDALVGQSAVFGAITPSLINFGDRNSFSFTNEVNGLPFSISIWINASALPTGPTDQLAVLSKQTNTSTREYLLSIEGSNNKTVASLRNSTATTRAINSAENNSIVTNTWVHYLITGDGSTGISGIDLYKNGVLQSSKIAIDIYTGMTNTVAPLRLGVVNANAFNFKGKMCQFAIFNKVLNLNEVNSVYQKGKNGQNLI